MTSHSRNLYGFCLLGALLASMPAFAEKPAAKSAAPSPEANYYLPPQALRTADGLPEFGLVDPFSRGPRVAADAPDSGDPSLLRTTMGELDDGFKILAIAVPSEKGKGPTALIQLEEEAEPTLVHEGDLVRVERKKDKRFSFQKKSAVEMALERYTFYIHIKSITATGLEVYYNKKRPDDTIILRW